MKYLRSKPGFLAAITASILVGCAPDASARTEPGPRKAVDALTTMRLVESVDAYCFRWAGSAGDHQKLLCDINPDLHVSKPQMAKRLRRNGIRLLDWNTIDSPKWPRHFAWVSIKSVSRLSKRRARVTIDWDADRDDQIIDEAIGTMFLDYRHGRWVVNACESKIVTGE